MKKYEEMELEILRKAVDESQAKIGKQTVQSPEIQEIIGIVEVFLRKKKLICYGGIAINNILPADDQFYNRETEIPDYDFYSPNAMADATELADIYYAKGYTEVEAKAAQHPGTFKVFVNFIGVADITDVPQALFDSIEHDSIVIDGIHYVSANFLRMGVYKELSNPAGDTSRFEKIYKRLLLLNKYYPITNLNCNQVEYQRTMLDESHKQQIYESLLKVFSDYGCVFFGGHALSVYAQYMPEKIKEKLTHGNPDFDVLSTEPETVLDTLKKELRTHRLPMRVIKHPPVGEIVPASYEVIIQKDTVAFVYQTDRCHSYNELVVKGKKVKIATIDTMLHLYFSFLYANKPYYDATRIICMCNFLFNVQQENKLSQKGVLKRFSTTCYGPQEKMEDIKLKKSRLYQKLKHRRNDPEYQYYFFNYQPAGEFNPATRRVFSKGRKSPASSDVFRQSAKRSLSSLSSVESVPSSSLESPMPTAIETLDTKRSFSKYHKKAKYFSKKRFHAPRSRYASNYLSAFKHGKTQKGRRRPLV